MTTTTIIAPTPFDTTTDCGSGTILVAVNGRKSARGPSLRGLRA